MEEKKAKEDQAPTGGGEVGRVRVGAGKGGAERGRVLDGDLFLFLVLGDQQQLVAFV